MYQDKHLEALRKTYKKRLLSYLGTAALFAVVGGFLLIPQIIEAFESSPAEGADGRNTLLPVFLLAAFAVALILAAVENTLRRALLKRGVNTVWVTVVQFAFILLLILLAFGFNRVLLSSNALSLITVIGYLLISPLFPAVSLLRDHSKLKEGDLDETVGRMKPNGRREAGSSSETYILFEDELTHEVHLLRMSHISPLHRYQVFYLPHSGLAVGEVIPDNVTFDPFGNPIEREADEAEPATEKPAYTEESYAEKPDYIEESYTVKPNYTEEEPTEKPWYQNPEAFSNDPPKEEPRETEIPPAPNSPERQRAAKFAVASKVCNVLTFVFIGLMFFGTIALRDGSSLAFVFLFLPAIVSAILHSVCKDKELKLRCTRRTTAYCVDTVRRRSGKHSHLHPIVEYEAKGATLTAELSVTCSRDAVGDLYTIYYDPLDPKTVRAERRGLFE